MTDKSFYMVFLEDQRAPTYKHSTFDSAKQEAKRLAKLYGQKAYILCSLQSIEVSEFNVEDLRPDNDGDLPF